MPLLNSKSEQDQYSCARSKLQDNSPSKRSKNVSQRRRKSGRKDAVTLEKMRTFCPAPASLPEESLVATSHTPFPHPSYPQSNTPKPVLLTPPSHNNDNHIPVWALTGDIVKAVAATAALQIGEKPAYAFTFNLTEKAERKALSHPAGFLNSLKRSFDKQLSKAGVSLPYWFAVDISREGRLHIHGTFGADLEQHQLLKETMRAAWGPWPGQGLQFQVDFTPLQDDGWASYCLRNQRRVAKIIGSRTFTLTRPLQGEAQWTYEMIRQIMRTS